MLSFVRCLVTWVGLVLSATQFGKNHSPSGLCPSHSGLAEAGATVSPGTVVLSDLMTMEMCPTLNLLPAALVATRVVSFPAEDVFTCDVGSKSVAAELPEHGVGMFLGHTPGFVVGRCSTSGDAGHVTYSSCNVSPVHTGVIVGNLLQFLPPAAK